MTDQLSTQPHQDAPAALRVRPYTVTGGRTRADVELGIETMIRTVGPVADPERDRTLVSEARAILELCATPQSIAEISAHLRLPLQVVKILVGDLVSSKRAATHSAAAGAGARPDLALLERVLDGLQSL
jgi:hypothetical protein